MRRRSNLSSTIEQYARQHRCALNGPEQTLWSELRGCRLGVWFRRQVVIGRFIVDFLAPRDRLIVEVDGRYHATRVGADARRDRKLTRMGYRVLRLDAELVRGDVHAAVEQVRSALMPPP
jgi:very-short-patch-repair endonuclease